MKKVVCYLDETGNLFTSNNASYLLGFYPSAPFESVPESSSGCSGTPESVSLKTLDILDKCVTKIIGD
jgi:hypothetical protein